MVLGVEPAVVGTAKTGEAADVDHVVLPGNTGLDEWMGVFSSDPFAAEHRFPERIVFPGSALQGCKPNPCAHVGRIGGATPPPLRGIPE